MQFAKTTFELRIKCRNIPEGIAKHFFPGTLDPDEVWRWSHRIARGYCSNENPAHLTLFRRIAETVNGHYQTTMKTLREAPCVKPR